MDFSFLQSLTGRSNEPRVQKAAPQPRPALQPVKANVIQRIKTFMGEPASDAGTSAMKKAKTPSETPSKRSVTGTPVKLLNVSTSNVTPKSRARSAVMLSDDIMHLVMDHLDMETAFKARAVCKSWKKIVSEAGMEPLEANVTGEALIDGIQNQRMLESSLEREAAIYNEKQRAALAGHMTWQTEITPTMRKTLVNWLVEVHFKFRFREPSLALTIQLLDRFMSMDVVTRRRYQTVGVTAFMLGVKFEERHNPSLGDLSYITDYSSSRQQILDMEKEMLNAVNYDLVHPKPTDFMTRLLHASGLEKPAQNHLPKGEYTAVQATVHFFLDVIALDQQFLGMRPSLLCAAAISCALTVARRPAWNRKLGFYAQCSKEEVTFLADCVLASAKLSVMASNCLNLKYQAPRMGGSKATNVPGVFDKLKTFLANHSAPDKSPKPLTQGSNAPAPAAPGPVTYALV